jgi:hypothetical protein
LLSVRVIRGLVKLSEILFALSGIQPEIAEHRVHTEPPSSISPKERTGLMPSFEPLYKRIVGKRKMIRLYLIGMLCGVMITAAVTYVFAIPANSNYWRMEIWKRGGGAWTMDMKSGRTGWKWMVEPIPDTPPKKPAIVPLSQTKVSTEQL